MRRLAVASVLVLPLGLLVAAPTSGSSAAAPVAEHRATSAPAPEVRRAPGLDVRRVAGGLDIPWDVQPVGDGRLLVTERDRARLLLIDADGGQRAVDFPSGSVWRSDETGLMSLAVDPGFAANRRIYTCQGARRSGGRHDIRVVAWRLDADLRRAARFRTLVKGLPTRNGRHGGCRLLILRSGALVIGTGDAAVGRNPRNLRSLGGKTLRVDRTTGRAWPSNPYARSASRRKRLVLTYGHRNVQGLAQRSDGSVWSIEHGSFRDDEVNLLVKGGDYGWHPVPGYNESVPMTDQRLPGRQRGARWRSGRPTIATSGGTFVRGRAWGSLRGTLAVAALAGQRLVFLKFDRRGRFRSARAPQALRRYGRLRSVTSAPNGDLLVTTANGEGRDQVLRVSPR
ncbi:PQQ-dependent sugar dehydrogenase [Nocardioides pantholopis]|uniref:PQQ-dependent sugar dehydrogenase n=1 Tax=Nocardioides pantholopis TaxID=2483798 RepID=UPI000F092519|nr:PQQ-dependent sugar dehydrogenase [Nocardioides pantholopis]